MLAMITSIANQKIKDVVKLRDSVSCRKNNLFIIEGCREISLALTAGINIKELYFCRNFFKGIKEEEAITLSGNRNSVIYEVNRKVYKKIAYGKRREGLIAVAEQPKYKLADIQLTANPFLVVAERIEKPGNLGAILRTIDAAGSDGLIAVDSLTSVYNHKVVRASVGTIFTKPVITTSSQELVAWLEKQDIIIICADPAGSLAYTLVDFKKPTVLILGSEKKGISSFWKNQASVIASIPMEGKADSLNVSVTAAVFIFEALRQRSQ